MALKNSQYYAIMREYEQRQLRNHDIQTARYEEVYKKLPEFKSLDESISILSVQYGKKLLNGDSHALDALKEELEILRSSKKNLLVSAGFPEDYLEPVYDCPACKDTGNATASKKLSSGFCTSSPIYGNFLLKRLLRISVLIFILRPFMIKQPGGVPAP